MSKFKLMMVLPWGALMLFAGGDPQPLSNKIKWATAMEAENFGYNVYRADAEDGPFTKLNQNPIEGAGTTDETTRYEYVDDTIEAGKAYWYYVESISLEGVREKFTPVFRAKPKEAPTTKDP